jgi:glutathione peroxidase
VQWRLPLNSTCIDRTLFFFVAEFSPGESRFSEKLKTYGIAPNPEPEVLWNFEKFLVGRTGEVVNRFAPDTVPDDPALVAAIEAELAKR